MTQPADPTPGAPAGTDPAPPTTQPPAAPPSPSSQPPAPFDPSSLPPEAQAYLKSQIDAADLKARTGSKANAAADARREMAAQVALALGLGGAEPPSPDQLQAQLEQARDDQWATAVENQILRIVGVDAAERLLDSRKFIDSLDDLGDDPQSPEFREALKAKVQEAAAQLTPSTPGAPTGPRPDPSQGTRGTPPAARPTSLTAAFQQHYAKR